MGSIEGCASIADSVGNLQCYTDGEQVWNRLGAVMPNGRLLSGESQQRRPRAHVASRTPAIPAVPAVHHRCGAFLHGGLRYSIIDMRENAGTGAVLMPCSVLVPTPTRPYVTTEALTAVRHANGTDYWVVVHGWQSDEFLSYRMLPTGLDTLPVRSRAGRVHGPAGPPVTPYARVAMRASPDGPGWCLGLPNQGADLFDFNSLTGQVSNARAISQLPAFLSGYGLEFSLDSNVLYVAELGGRLCQVDLSNGLNVLQLDNSGYAALQMGPDGRIYAANYQARTLGVISLPSVVGAGCRLLPAGQDLAGRRSLYGLPNFPNQAPRPTRIVAPREGCVGQPVTFSAEGLLVSGTGQQWDFGDPAAGAANFAVGNPVVHRYTQPGTYLVALTLNTVVGAVRRTQQIRVSETPVLRLFPRDTLICELAEVLLQATPQPSGTTFRWQDGSTEPTLLARTAGRYTLEVRNAGGCLARDSVVVSSRPCVLPNIITPNGDALNQNFVLAGLNPASWNVRLYNRWGREIYRKEPYNNSWAAQGQPDGIYYYVLTHTATGQRLKGWLEVRRYGFIP